MLSAPARLSDTELLAAVAQLAARERDVTVALIAHLAELDARRLYLAEGYPSLFTYCTQALHLSEHAAYGRIEAARAARRFPVLLEHLADGSITLTTVTLLAPHLTAENHRDLLDRARHRSRREVEALVAALRPQPPVPASVRRLSTLRTAPAAPPPPAQTATVGSPAFAPAPSSAASPRAPAPCTVASAMAPTSTATSGKSSTAR